MELLEKLEILSDAAKYDVACTSSGVDRAGKKGQLGSAAAAGICHSFTADGRCVSLLKVLMTNICAYDCKYCVNRCSNATPPRRFFAPGAGRPDHPVLPPKLHRGAVFEFRHPQKPRLHL